jgi:hypothetical protein
MFSLLTLDPVTLHYWTLSNAADNRQKRGSAIKAWASAVPNGKPTSRASKSIFSHVPSLTTGASRSSAPSVLTNKVKIFSHQVSDSVKVKDEPAPMISLFDGGLSDNDEMRGEEREAAINSPPKGKKRVTSEVGPSESCCSAWQSNHHHNQQLIVQKSSKVAPKKPRNVKLPKWVDATWFRHTFVTTYMEFVGKTADPWDVPVKQAIKVMQKIWDTTSSYDYEITSSSIIYQKVCDRFSFRTISKLVSDGSTPRGLMAQPCWICRHRDHPGIL